MLKTLSAIILSTAISSCGITPTTPRLPLPDRPLLPRIDFQKYECLDKDTFNNFVMREEILKGHITRLEAIIRATQ